MPETVERTETVETLETVETTEKANPSETSDKANNLHFRVRSFESAATYNRNHADEIPPSFRWSHRIFR
ncbi:hypothetical protein PC118_g15011 [Phytophthora cactorum]|uniref:Uncharacterized protein n=1 Tax=Phytophthora cactorum TaxID=29920 RepID=A0A8T1FKJ1_9STRA|nr:hypothetical protein PC112_g15003 [Phytophthora cactorum]KAG2973636.1 hypothetical protein PC118_g15011 [Phytophthora cactorum]KAG3149857.1 hypothetical protein C6341_g16911 [Phytophthora cactorum]